MIAPYRLQRPLLDKEATLGPLCGALGLDVPTKAHVTIAWSAAPVDWDLPVFAAHPGPLLVAPASPRLELFDDGAALVLAFECPALENRHARLMAAGTSWAHAHYIPHITLGRHPGPLPTVDRALLPTLLHFGPEHRRDP